MNEFLVSTDSMGVIHLYDCNLQRPGPDRSWHGFRSYQDLSDFFTFGLRGPAPDLPPFPPELMQEQPFKGFPVTIEQLDVLLADADEENDRRAQILDARRWRATEEV